MPKKRFSWKRATRITKIKRDFARKTGIPTTRSGRKRKVKRILKRTATGGGCIFTILIGMVIIIMIIITFINL